MVAYSCTNTKVVFDLVFHASHDCQASAAPLPTFNFRPHSVHFLEFPVYITCRMFISNLITVNLLKIRTQEEHIRNVVRVFNDMTVPWVLSGTYMTEPPIKGTAPDAPKLLTRWLGPAGQTEFCDAECKIWGGLDRQSNDQSQRGQDDVWCCSPLTEVDKVMLEAEEKGSPEAAQFPKWHRETKRKPGKVHHQQRKGGWVSTSPRLRIQKRVSKHVFLVPWKVIKPFEQCWKIGGSIVGARCFKVHGCWSIFYFEGKLCI